jgi:hypothetical protein
MDKNIIKETMLSLDGATKRAGKRSTTYLMRSLRARNQDYEIVSSLS